MEKNGDITEPGLIGNEALLAAVLNNVLDGIITINERGIVQLFNKSAEKIFGYAAAEVVGRNVNMLMPAPYHAEHDSYLGNYLASGIKKIIGIGREVSGQRKDGTIFPLDLAVSEVWIGQGRMFTGIVRDITERKRNEDDLRKLSRAVEQSPVSVVITDAKGDIEYVNTKFSEVSGYAASEVLGKNPRILQSGLTPLKVYQDMWQTILGGNEWRGRLQNRRKNGQLYWEYAYFSAVRDSEGVITHFVAVKEDITERMKIERMKSEFISTVSHELRTPLTSIRGSLSLIAGGVSGELSEQTKALVEIAHKNSERLILLVNDILDTEKIESGKIEFNPKPVELMHVLHQALESNRAYGEQFKVNYELEGDLPGVMLNVDENRLIQVLTNLLSNAAKFSPSGGKVTVAVTRNDKTIRVAVNDRGSGIPEAFRSRIFQKFAQADSSDTRKKGGTGLGLSITKALVEKMGGSIGFDSQPNVLTTFFVEFPVWEKTAIPVPKKPEGKVRRVLICEDDHDIAELLRMMLEQDGALEADIAYGATQAKQMLAQGNYVAMTLDLGLPDQDGIALIRELRMKKETSALPIIVVSARAIEGQQELDGETFSVVDWINKPINREQLVLAMKRALGRVADMRPRVLHVEDDPDIFQVVHGIVGGVADLDHALNVSEARQLLGQRRYDLVILDITLPDGSGKELLPVLNSATPPIPVMVFSAHEMCMQDLQQINSALVKSRTGNAHLLATVKRLIGAK